MRARIKDGNCWYGPLSLTPQAEIGQRKAQAAYSCRSPRFPGGLFLAVLAKTHSPNDQRQEADKLPWNHILLLKWGTGKQPRLCSSNRNYSTSKKPYCQVLRTNSEFCASCVLKTRSIQGFVFAGLLGIMKSWFQHLHHQFEYLLPFLLRVLKISRRVDVEVRLAWFENCFLVGRRNSKVFCSIWKIISQVILNR